MGCVGCGAVKRGEGGCGMRIGDGWVEEHKC